MSTFLICRRLLAPLALLILLPLCALAQDGPTSMGTDFWIGMMPNWTTPADNIRIFVASPTNNEVHCDFYGGSAQPVDTRKATVKANDVYTFYQYSTALAEERKQEVPEYKAIHVYSTSPIVVYGMTNSGATTDSYLALPTPSLGTEYIASCFYDDHYNFGLPWLAGEFLIVAPYDDTHVTIHSVRAPTRLDPDGSVASHAAGDTWSVSLQRGQTYLVQSTGLGYGEDDLTGTSITSDKPIGFISGHQRCSIPIGATNDSKDHLCEMYPPLDKWGTEYYDQPMAGRTECGDYIRLIAGDDNVRITENGRMIAILEKKGDYFDRELVTDPVMFKSVGSGGFSSTKKFLAVLMSYSEHQNGDPGLGDPFSIALPSREQFQKRMFFRCPNKNSSGAGNTFTHYVTFITLADSIDRIKLNGKSITSYRIVGRTQIPTTNMSAIRISGLASNAAYLAECGAPFGAYMYGLTDVESYGHPAGMGLRLYSSADTIAPVEHHDSSCGSFRIQIRDVNKVGFIDSRISEIGMVTESNDLRWSKPGYNFDLSYDRPFTPGDDSAALSLAPIDPFKDAYAPIWTTDRAGNVAVYEYSYVAPHVAITPTEAPVRFRSVLLGSDSCRIITFKNVAGTVLIIDSVRLGSVASPFRLATHNDGITLRVSDSLESQVCFTPTDTLIKSDTLRIWTPCVAFAIALEGRGMKPKPIDTTSGVEDYPFAHATDFQLLYAEANSDKLFAVAQEVFQGTFEITDVTGARRSLKAIQSQAGELVSVDIKGLVPGVYFLTIRSNTGKVEVLKFVRK